MVSIKACCEESWNTAESECCQITAESGFGSKRWGRPDRETNFEPPLQLKTKRYEFSFF